VALVEVLSALRWRSAKPVTMVLVTARAALHGESWKLLCLTMPMAGTQTMLLDLMVLMTLMLPAASMGLHGMCKGMVQCQLGCDRDVAGGRGDLRTRALAMQMEAVTEAMPRGWCGDPWAHPLEKLRASAAPAAPRAWQLLLNTLEGAAPRERAKGKAKAKAKAAERAEAKTDAELRSNFTSLC